VRAREEGYKSMVEKTNSINNKRAISIPAFKMETFAHNLSGWEWKSVNSGDDSSGWSCCDENMDLKGSP